MDFQELERLIDIVQHAAISELTIKQGDSRITIKRALYPPAPAISAQVEEEADALSDIPLEEDAISTPAKFTTVTSPLVGTFAHVHPPVGVGTRVKKGQVIAQIEAMGLKNEVTAPVDGVVCEVLVEDMQPVEYAQELFVISSEGP